MSWFADSIKKIYDLELRLKAMEEQFDSINYDAAEGVQNQLKKSWVTNVQAETFYGLRIGLCVDTKDPFAQGRIRVYIPSLHSKDTPLKSLPWAYPISSLGGFDDSGALWVPPAGSSVALTFEVGDRESPYYMGTVWGRDRGKPPHNWNYGIPEYQCIHEGHRKGYLVGPNDESQVLPPQNTYNYNIKDFDDLKAFEQDTEALRKITPSHYYTLKTPEKHRLTFDDGNYFCNHRWKHLSLASSGGQTFLMWDDHLHAAGQHIHPSMGSAKGSSTSTGLDCGTTPDGGDESCRNEELETCTGDDGQAQNNLFKHASEGRAFTGPGTPQNNRCQLQQTGVFLSSVSGQVFTMDDEVDEPNGVPNWERGTQPFDTGCNDKLLGKMSLISSTGHMIRLGDAEDSPNVRSGEFIHHKTKRDEFNGMLFRTATGHSIEMNDHTLAGGTAGQKRHIRIQSTSTHLFEMVDYTNEQKSPPRSEGGVPTPKSKQAYVRLKSGYGLQILMRDDNSQESTENQFLELLAPHKDNCHGPHIIRMQEAPSDAPGLVFLRAGGYFYGMSAKEWIEVVGYSEACVQSPPSKFTMVENHDLHDTKQMYYYHSEFEFHFAEKFIILGAGRDCPIPDSDERGPCIYPVIVGKCPWVCPFTGFVHFGVDSMSDRVFASSRPEPCGESAGGGEQDQDQDQEQ